MSLPTTINSQVGKAVAFLQERLSEDEPVSSRVLKDDGRALGITESALYRAAGRLGVIVTSDSWPRRTCWQLGGDPRVRKTSVEATEWLRDQLSNGPVLSAEIKDRSRSAGHSDGDLRRATHRVGIVVSSHGWPRVTTWALYRTPSPTAYPPGALYRPPDPQDTSPPVRECVCPYLARS